MEQSPSWETNWFSASQEIPCILWNLKVHYHIRKCPPPVPIQSQLNTFYTPIPKSWRSILILSSHLCWVFQVASLPQVFPPNPWIRLSFRCATCTIHHFLLDFITRIIYGVQYRSLSSSICSFLHSPVTSSLLAPNRYHRATKLRCVNSSSDTNW
jgi:hypothetical protein